MPIGSTLHRHAANMASNADEYALYTYFRSSCSGRIRIAMNLKNISYTPIFINLLRGDQSAESYGKINPSCSVPTLKITKSSGKEVYITQSIAVLEYLEDVFPNQRPLLPPPSDPEGRASVRTLVNVIAVDTQPVTNLRILQRVSGLGAPKEVWSKELQERGLKVYERVVEETAGKFSVGDSITLADVCLVPAVWGAMRWGVDMDAYPITKRIYEELSKENAVKQAHWANQDDTPSDLRQ